MDQRAAEAFLNREHRVLGFRLRPFCLWHAFLLDVYGSPFRQGGCEGEPTFEDLAVAVSVCRYGYRQPRFPRLGPIRQLRYFSARRSPAKHLTAFANYLKDYNALPLMGRAEGGRSVNVPWQLFRVAQLMHYARWTPQQAWEAPLGLAVWYACALAEATGVETHVASEDLQAALREAGYSQP